MQTALLAVSLLSAAITGGMLCIPTRTVGGLTFWRIGRIGGSVYLARRSPQ